MNEILRRIKRAVLARRFDLTVKAQTELDLCDLTDADVIESIVQATEIAKTIRSRSPHRPLHREYLHIIISPNLAGVSIYTKGKLTKEHGQDVYYIFISAKHAD